jgi:ribosomal protein L11 methyltransferase
MNDSYLEIRLTVPAIGIDLVCHAMAELGSTGTTVEERPLDTFTPPDPDEPGAEHQTIKIYFPPQEDPAALCEQIEQSLMRLAGLVPGLKPLRPQARRVRAEDWAENWKQHFGIMRIGPRLVIRPTWESFTPGPDDAVLTLDPGMAFGTGTHATTRLCLEVLAELYQTPPMPRRVLDVGTGSGILAIAAALLGAQRVVGCDIEETACRTARENARLNGVSSEVEITSTPLAQLKDRYDVVLANILAEENARLASQLIERLAEGGTLILSGILQEKEALVLAAFAGRGLGEPDIRRREEWSCLSYRRTA